MDVLEYCQSNHLCDDINDLDLHLRLCGFCRKAMCEACFDIHRHHCSEQAQPNKRNANHMVSTCEGPQMKKSRTYPPLEKCGASYVLPLYHSSSKTTQPPPEWGNTYIFTNCLVHSLSEDQFCISHCKLMCQQCHADHHATCTIKPAAVVCESLDHTTVTEYKKWLNNLRVSGIEIKTFLGRNLESAEKSKKSALEDLKTKFSKANENLNNAFLDTKSEIERTFDKHFSDTWQKMSEIDALDSKLENSLSESRILEGRRMDVKLFLKLLNIISKYNNKALYGAIKTLCEESRKVKFSFVANICYQPLSSRSNLGHVNRVETRLTNISPVSTTDVSHVFSKLSKGRSECPSTRTEKINPNKTKESQTSLMTGEMAESGHAASNSNKFESETINNDFIAKTTGQYAPGYANKTNTRQNDSPASDDSHAISSCDYEHIHLNENENANGLCKERTVFPKMLRSDPENIENNIDNVKESSASKLNSSAKFVKIQAPSEQNKNNVVLLNGSPYILVPYNTVLFSHGKGGHNQCDNQLADRPGYSSGAASNGPSHNLSEQMNPLGNTDKKEDHMPQSPEQSSRERRCTQIYMADSRNAQIATLIDKSNESVKSQDQVELSVPKQQMNEQDNSLQLKCSTNFAEIYGQSDNVAYSGKETANGNLVRSGNATIDSSAAAKERVVIGTSFSLSESSASLDQQHNGTASNIPTSEELNVPNLSIEVSQSSIEKRKKDEYSNFDALLSVASSIAFSSQERENSAAKDLAQNSSEVNSATEFANNYNRHTWDGMPSTETVANNKNNVSIGTDPNIQGLRKLENNPCNSNINTVMISNVFPTFSINELEPKTTSSEGKSIETGSTGISSVNVQPCVDIKQHSKKNKNINSITAEIAEEINIKVSGDKFTGCITGIDVTSDGRIILTDNDNEKVKMISSDRKRIACLPLTGSFDVTVYNNDTAVVTSGITNLFFIAISGLYLKITNTVKLTFRPDRIQTCGNNLLIASFDDCSVKLVCISGNVLWSVAMKERERGLLVHDIYYYKHQGCGRVLVTGWDTDQVIVLDGDTGEVVQKSSMKGKQPRCVTVDSHGNFFVCCKTTDEIVVLNRNFSRKRVLPVLMIEPWQIVFDDYNYQLIICCYQDNIIKCFELS